ncbi:MAG TPA: response regulator [Acidimicrobiales bacterium]|nr:response regulator [Acidimicrobiales bacterium]
MGEETPRHAQEDWRPPAWSRLDQGHEERRGGKAVLVVDDAEAIRTSVADILRAVGYTVIEACDGLEAQRFLSTMRFDAMVLDLNMPRMDGVSLLAAVRRPPPVVVLSAFTLDEEARRRVGSAIVTHLEKPVQPQRLLEALEAAIATKQA